jgi:hypothetical protein
MRIAAALPTPTVMRILGCFFFCHIETIALRETEFIVADFTVTDYTVSGLMQG